MPLAGRAEGGARVTMYAPVVATYTSSEPLPPVPAATTEPSGSATNTLVPEGNVLRSMCQYLPLSPALMVRLYTSRSDRLAKHACTEDWAVMSVACATVSLGSLGSAQGAGVGVGFSVTTWVKR